MNARLDQRRMLTPTGTTLPGPASVVVNRADGGVPTHIAP